VDYSPSALSAQKYKVKDQFRDKNENRQNGRGGGNSQQSRYSDEENEPQDRSIRRGMSVVQILTIREVHMYTLLLIGRNAPPVESAPSPPQRFRALQDMHGNSGEREAKQR